jgi:protein-tyrosine-phosphatase
MLKQKFNESYEFFSAGIAPISMPNMDPRSLKFLEENNINYEFHTPKKINKKMLNYFDRFLAVDFYVLNQLNVMYPNYKHKFLPLTMQFDDINIVDPYQFQADEYLKVMNDIKHIVERINLEGM